MKKLLTLLEIEIKKLLPIMLIIFSLMTLASMALFHGAANSLRRDILRQIAGSSVEEFVSITGGIALIDLIAENFGIHYFLFSVAAFFLVVISSFYLWYKEWFGQSKRIYLLLTLRGSRFTILISKLITVIGATFVFYGVILLNLFIGDMMLRIIMPDGLVTANGIASVLSQATSGGLGFAFPLSFSNLIYKIFFVMIAFTGISVWVLLNRSKKILGFILGGAFCIFLGILYIHTQTMFLFFDERPLVDWGFALGANAVNLLISYVLLNKTVSI